MTPATVVAPSGVLRALAWIGLPALGAGAGWLLVAASAWLLSLPWLPMRGPLRLIESLPDPASIIGATVVGGIAGLVGGWFVSHGGLLVTVADSRITLTRGDTTQDFDRGRIKAAFLDGDQLVLLDPDGRELAREPGSLIAHRLAEPLRRHGYPWLPDGDPHRDAYRRWVPATPDLPPGADALLQARQRALEKDLRDDIVELRAELARLDIVVRDERKRQYWRRSAPPR